MEKIDERTFKFAVQIVKFVRELPASNDGLILGRQVLRSGTSIGANAEEAYGTPTKRDFTNKMATALKEARETHYWLRVIRESGLVPPQRINLLIQEALEIKLILTQTLKTSRR